MKRKLLLKSALAGCLVVVGITAQLDADWTFTYPTYDEHIFTYRDVLAHGAADGPDLGFTIECIDDDGVVQTSYSNTSDGSSNWSVPTDSGLYFESDAEGNSIYGGTVRIYGDPTYVVDMDVIVYDK